MQVPWPCLVSLREGRLASPENGGNPPGRNTVRTQKFYMELIILGAPTAYQWEKGAIMLKKILAACKSCSELLSFLETSESPELVIEEDDNTMVIKYKGFLRNTGYPLKGSSCVFLPEYSSSKRLIDSIELYNSKRINHEDLVKRVDTCYRQFNNLLYQSLESEMERQEKQDLLRLNRLKEQADIIRKISDKVEEFNNRPKPTTEK